MQLAVLFIIATAEPGGGAHIECEGVLGNSGELGAALVRVKPEMEENRGSTGAYIDAEETLWVGAGDSINRLGMDGHLIEHFELDPRGSRVDSFTFAALGDFLYFVGQTPSKQWALFALTLHGGQRSAHPLDVSLFDPGLGRIVIAPQTLDGRELLLAGVRLQRSAAQFQTGTVAVFSLDPAMKKITPRFEIPGRSIEGLAWDQTRSILYAGGILFRDQKFAPSITAVDLAGNPINNTFPVSVVPTPAQATSFRGRVSRAAGALWDAGHYGYLARMDLNARGAPGIVARWMHAIDEPAQVLAVDNTESSPLIVTCTVADAVYLATWDDVNNSFTLRRRFGALPVIASVGLSADGWVTVGTAFSQLWWRWNDGPSAVPRMVDMSVATTGGFWEHDQFCALGGIKDLAETLKKPPTSLVFSLHGSETQRPMHGNPVPIQQPIGLAVQTVPKPLLFVTDAATHKLWRVSLSLPQFAPLDEAWQPVTISGVMLDSPTDVVALDDGSLLIADRARVLQLVPNAGGFKPAWQWPSGNAEKTGAKLRIASDDTSLLISDEERQRVLWLDLKTRTVRAQFGATDERGDDLAHLNAPRQIAFCGDHAVVADTGNQRLLKLRLTYD
jgi:hypothetical protein